MNADELIKQLKAKADAEGISQRFPPMTLSQVAELEKALKFKLPEILKRVYTEVANGGVGPGGQLVGFQGGKLTEGRLRQEDDEFNDAVGMYVGLMSMEIEWEDFDDEANDEIWEWQPGLLPLCDWEEFDLTVVDCKSKKPTALMMSFEGHVNIRKAFKERDETVFDFPGTPLEEWLASWLNGTDKQYIGHFWQPESAEESESPVPFRPKHAETDPLKETQKRAEAGERESQTKLGEMYLERGEYREAFIWFEVAAERNDFYAMMHIMPMLQIGLSCIADWYRALAFAKSVLQTRTNMTVPTFFLDDVYAEIPFERENFSKEYCESWWRNALLWWERRAYDGDGQAAFSLAIAHKNGWGTPSNTAASLKWCARAAELNYAPAKRLSAELAGAGTIDIASARGTFTARSSDELDLLAKAAESDYEDAQYKLWQHYSHDKDNPDSWELALKYLRMAAKPRKGKPETRKRHLASWELANVYLEGRPGTPEIEKVVKLLTRIAGARDGKACYKLGMMYKNGSLVEQNFAEAAKWFQYGMEGCCHAACTYELGLCYQNGHGVTKNEERAQRYFTKARAKGYAPSAEP